MTKKDKANAPKKDEPKSAKKMKFEIREQGFTFATITAPSAEKALEIADRTFARHRVDYHMEPGDEPFTVRWYAWPADGGGTLTTRDVKVPSDT